ncbi:MAG: hypothetical protein HOP28_15975 [Gemmatimonadales bacterium]|nr:hypothetical protein [Gemmatimonadales bacterium]
MTAELGDEATATGLAETDREPEVSIEGVRDSGHLKRNRRKSRNRTERKDGPDLIDIETVNDRSAEPDDAQHMRV